MQPLNIAPLQYLIIKADQIVELRILITNLLDQGEKLNLANPFNQAVNKIGTLTHTELG